MSTRSYGRSLMQAANLPQRETKPVEARAMRHIHMDRGDRDVVLRHRLQIGPRLLHVVGAQTANPDLGLAARVDPLQQLVAELALALRREPIAADRRRCTHQVHVRLQHRAYFQGAG